MPTITTNTIIFAGARRFAGRGLFAIRSGLAVLFLSVFIVSSPARAQSAHPRLWITTNDLPRLRSWATLDNPVFANGLASISEAAKQAMDVVDSNNVPPAPDVPYADDGASSYESYPTEMYAQLFAFMSLISPNAADRDDYGRRATNLLMHAMNQAVLGPDTNDPPAPFRSSQFYDYDSNRARWYGEGWALAVDWAYSYINPADKATIRQVFIGWADGIVTNAYPLSPQPFGVFNDPRLTAEGSLYGEPFSPERWAGNNYFAAHMRNLGLMAMALDSADDPGGELRQYLSPATGAFLYLVDNLLRNDSRGGLLPEGMEYSPQTGGYIAQFLFALRSAGQDNSSLWGPQVVFTNQPFWADFFHAYLNSVSPSVGQGVIDDVPLSFHYAAWYGDGQRIYAPDFIASFGPLGLMAEKLGDTNHLNAARWIEQNLAPDGADGFMDRVGGDNNSFTANIFLLLAFRPRVRGSGRPASSRAVRLVRARYGPNFVALGVGHERLLVHL